MKRFASLALMAAATMMMAMSLPLHAKVTMPPFFSDHMVLQHSADVKLWGTAEPGATVKIKASWKGGHAKTVAGPDGCWSLTLRTPGPGGPHTLTVSDGEKLTFSDILTGEVWLCGGQSNMEMKIEDKVTGWEQELAESATHGNIRLLHVSKRISAKPVDTIDIENGGWTTVTPETLSPFSATAWFYGKEIAARTGMPVGLIESCWGGTLIESWTSARTLGPIGRFQAQIDMLKEMPDDKQARHLIFEQQVARWEEEMAKVDFAYTDGRLVWAQPEADLEGWTACKVPGYLQWQGLSGYHGFFWMRREVELPASWAGQDLELRLGGVDDDDCTWFNGEFVGHTELCVIQRRYAIPGRLVRAGRNTIAVRVRDSGGLSGIMGDDSNLHLRNLATGEMIPISGDWLCRETVDPGKTPVFPIDLDNNFNGPTTLYNAMIHPLRDYRIRGVIWYQGESNSSAAADYKVYMPALIRDWRQVWGYDFPFYFAQIASDMKEQTGPERSEWAELREAQLQSLAVAGTGMAVLIDIGEAGDIHPKNKADVGRRLALNALYGTYGQDVIPSGPLYAGYSIEGDRIRIRFDWAQGLQTADGEALKGFWIAGPDRVFHPGTAVIDGETVVVSSPEVSNALSVRYGWANNPPCNLVNDAMLPASPFRTDCWER